MYNLYLGIDISKDFSSAQGLDSRGEKSLHVSFKMDYEGFQYLLRIIKSLCADFSKVIVSMEAIETYHIGFFSFLSSKGINAVVVNPLLVSNFARLSPGKIDKKDARTIAQFLFAHRDSLARSSTSDMPDLRDLSSQREDLMGQITPIRNDIKRLLAVTFPELEGLTEIFSDPVLQLLCRFPSAQAIKHAGDSGVHAALSSEPEKRMDPPLAASIIKAAETSKGSTSHVKDMILMQKASILMTLDEHLREVTSMLVGICQSITVEDIGMPALAGAITEKTADVPIIEIEELAVVSEKEPAAESEQEPAAEAVKKPAVESERQAKPQQNNKANGMLSAIKVQDRNFQIQTEHVGYPENCVVTIVVLNGKILMKRSSPPLETGDLKEIENIIKQRHAEVDAEVREKIHSVKR